MTGKINLNPQGQLYRQPLPSRPSIQSNISNSPNQNNKGVDFNRCSTEAFQSSAAIGKKVEDLKALINTVNNPELRTTAHFQTFKALVGLSICETVCNAVSFAITAKANPLEGERLLQDNFLLILSLKECDGKNPLDKILDQFISEMETYRIIGEINFIGSSVSFLQDAKQKTIGASLITSPQLFTTVTSLHEDAIKKFHGLTPEARNTLSEQIWRMDGEPNIYDYGYNTVLKDITRLLMHKEKCVVEQCLSKLETKKNPSFTFSTYCYYNENILPKSDSPATIENIQKLYYLRDLKLLLSDPNRSNDLVTSKYNKLSIEHKKMLKDVRELLCKIIAVASYKPQSEVSFGEHILNAKMRWLVKTQNKQGLTVIDQLISHYTAKIQLCRLEKEIDNFIQLAQSFPSPTHQTWMNAFNSLSLKAKEDLRYQIWYHNGGKDNPNFRYGDLNYGKRTIESDPGCLIREVSKGNSVLKAYRLELKNKQKSADTVLIADLERAKTLPQELIDVSTKPLEKETGLIDQLPESLRVAVVTAEFEPAGLGGLRPAVSGMVRAFGAQDTRVIMPLYRNGPIDEALIKNMKGTDHEVWVNGKRAHIMKATLLGGLRCYFIDHDVFWIPKKEDGVSAGNIYGKDFHHERRKWAIFQKAAADLCYNFSKKKHPIELIHCHDSQTALVPKFLKEHHFEEWTNGRTPVVHFTYHNNAEPMAFESDESISILGQVQLPKQPLNSFIEALQIADVKSTVSMQFGKESQMQQADFGNGLDYFVKKTAFEENLFGVVNGNTISWDPQKDEQLKNWISVLPDTQGVKVDLRFGPKSSVQELAQNTVRIQRELCAYLKGLSPKDDAYADLDPEKPIFMYVGRYDTRQKGINKLPLIMREAINSGAQFVCVGLEPDDDAKRILSDMKQFAKQRGNKGVLILEDHKVGKALKYQGVFGNLLRSICFPVFPSAYEPCGLVQGELNCYGRIPFATGAGGFVDTLQTEGPNANGYLFKRCNDWNSSEQDDEIKATLAKAIRDAIAVQEALYHGSIDDVAPHMERAKLIMKNALNSTWEKTPDGSLSPIVKRQLIDAKGFQRRKLRGGAGYVELNTLKL